MPDINTITAQLSRIGNDKALYIGDDGESLKGAGFWGRLFRKQQRFTSAVDNFCHTLSDTYGLNGIGSLARGMMAASGSNKLNGGTAKVLMQLAPLLTEVELNAENINLLVNAFSPYSKTGAIPSKDFVKSVLDIINNKPLTLGGGIQLMEDSQIDRQAKIDVFKAFFGPEESLKLQNYNTPQATCFRRYAAMIPFIKAKYPHGHITRKILADFMASVFAVKGERLPKFSAKELDRLSPAEFAERLKTMTNDFFDQHEGQNPETDPQSIVAGGNTLSGLYCAQYSFFSAKKIEAFASKSLAQGESITITSNDMYQDMLANSVMTGAAQHINKYRNEDGTFNVKGLYKDVVGDLERLGQQKSTEHCDELTLTLITQDEPPTATLLGRPIEAETEAQQQNDSLPTPLRDKCYSMFDKIGEKSRTQEQFAVIMLTLSQCGSMICTDLQNCGFAPAATLSEHSPFSIEVAFDEEGAAHVHYQLAQSEEAKVGKFSCDYTITAEGNIKSPTFTWTTAPHQIAD